MPGGRIRVRREKRGREAVSRHQGSVASGGTISHDRRGTAAVLVKAIRASVSGDSDAICEMYTEDVRGWSRRCASRRQPSSRSSSRIDENEFSDIELELAPLIVGGDQGVESVVASTTRLGATGDRQRAGDRADGTAIHAVRHHDRGVHGRPHLRIPRYWDESVSSSRPRLLPPRILGRSRCAEALRHGSLRRDV